MRPLQLLTPEAAVIDDREHHTSVQIPGPHAGKGRRKLAAKLGISGGVKTGVVEGLQKRQQVVLQ